MSMGWALPAIRWALYADLAIVFGLPTAAAVTGNRHAMDRWRRTLAVPALLGITVGLLGFLATVADMAGIATGQLDRSLVLPLVTGTAVGWAMIARSAALALFAVVAIGSSSWRLTLLILLGGIAVATLAWSGHAAASQGAASWIRLGGDIVHLFAALSWVGALALFAALLWRPQRCEPVLSGQVAQALAAFGFAGSVVVALLVSTGAANFLFLVPPADLPHVFHSLYGRLLLVKLALSGTMLGLAAINRFVLVPALQQARRPCEKRMAISRLRLSISLEVLAAFAVLGLVGWLGTLDPLGIDN